MSPLELRDSAVASDDDEAAVARLLAAAGPPPPAPELEVARLQEAARAEWRRRYAGRATPPRARRWTLAAAAAAVLVAAGIVALRPRSRAGAPAETLATLVVARSASDAAGAALAPGAPLAAGAAVRTGADGHAALALPGGRSLRLDAASELRLDSAHGFSLVRGALYVDSGAASAASAPELTTPAGRFVEVGTRFELRLLEAGAVRLRVREGEVRLAAGSAARAGEELRVAPDGSLERGRVAPWGLEWAWAAAAAPRPAIEGWSLARWLDWFSAESGLAVVYATEADARLANEIVLHGSFGALAPEEALAPVLSSAGFEHHVEPGGVRVAARGGLRTPS